MNNLSHRTQPNQNTPGNVNVEMGFVLPNDTVSERALLGSLLNNPKQILDVIAALTGADVFYAEEHQILYNAIITVFNEGVEIRPLTVIQLLKRGPHYALLHSRGLLLQQLQEEGVNVDQIGTALHLRELWGKRQAYESAARILLSIRENEPYEALISQNRQLTETLNKGILVGKDRSLDVIAEKAYQEMVEETNGGLAGVNTGLGKLNKKTGGWLNDDTVVVAGRPGANKTGFMLHCAKAAAVEGIPAAIYCVETSSEQLFKRLVSSVCHIPYGDLIKKRWEDGTPFSPDDKRAIREATDYIKSLPLHFYGNESFDIADMSYDLRNKQQRFGIGLAAFDYLQNIQDRTVKTNDLRVLVTNISKKLLFLRQQVNIPILELCQLSRATEARKNKRPQMTDLRESGQIEQDATRIIGLYRDDYYKLQSALNYMEKHNTYIEPVFDHIMELGFIKDRIGGPAMIKAWTDVGTNRIADEDPSKPARLEPQKTAPLNPYKFPDKAAKSFAEPDRENEEDDDTPF